jgi:hypothetical protein
VAVAGQARPAERVDPAVDDEQTPARYPIVDRVAIEAQLLQLRGRNDAMLPRRKRGESRISIKGCLTFA